MPLWPSCLPAPMPLVCLNDPGLLALIARTGRQIKRRVRCRWSLRPGMKCRSWGLLAAFLLVLIAIAPERARAVGPVETGMFSVTGVEVDVTDKDAASARTRAIIEAQVKAFYILAERLGSSEAAQRL